MVGYENKWKIWRTTAEKKEQKRVDIETTEPVKVYSIFHKTSAKINKPRITTRGEKEASDLRRRMPTVSRQY